MKYIQHGTVQITNMIMITMTVTIIHVSATVSMIGIA